MQKNDFLLTYYMQPLDAGNRRKFFGGLYFDNPRTIEEIEFVAKQLKDINRANRPAFPDAYGQVPSGCMTLMWLYHTYYLNNKLDPIVVRAHKNNKGVKDIYKKIASMWVIVRSDIALSDEKTKGVFEIKKDENNTLLKKDTRPKISKAQYTELTIKEFFSFFTFELSTNRFRGILLPTEYDTEKEKFLFIELLIAATNKNNKKFEYPYSSFAMTEPKILTLIDKVGQRYNDKKFLFMCKRIKYIFDVYFQDLEMCFIEIVGLIEMLIAHNPDSMRFNVEDSISKQFINKLSLVLYEEDHTIDLDHLKKELKFAYNIRSAIAHGNFQELDNNIEKLFKFYGFDKEEKSIEFEDRNSALDKLVSNAIDWLKILIKLYLEDETRLGIIKNM